MKSRLDQAVYARRLTSSRSEAESWIKLGKVTVDGQVVTKPGYFVTDDVTIALTARERYVSRAGLKLASVAGKFGLDFAGATVLDVGSSTGGFTDYALQHGAAKIIAVDVGTDQLHPSLRGDKRIELREKTDIRNVTLTSLGQSQRPIDIVVMDVSFISLREILPHIAGLVQSGSVVVAMFKPQFEAGRQQISKGIIKNDTVRRRILHDFELWVRQYFLIIDKADSDVAGAHGNRERFYLLKKR